MIEDIYIDAEESIYYDYDFTYGYILADVY